MSLELVSQRLRRERIQAAVLRRERIQVAAQQIFDSISGRAGLDMTLDEIKADIYEILDQRLKLLLDLHIHGYPESPIVKTSVSDEQPKHHTTVSKMLPMGLQLVCQSPLYTPGLRYFSDGRQRSESSATEWSDWAPVR